MPTVFPVADPRHRLCISVIRGFLLFYEAKIFWKRASRVSSSSLVGVTSSSLSTLFQRQTASQEELDSADHRLRVAGEEVRAAQFAAQIADFELDLARAALVRSRPGGSGNASPAGFEIRAPVDGRVLRVFQESEATLTTGARLLEVGDPTDLEVEVDVLSADAVKIAPGAKAILEHWGGAEPLSGTVRLVEPSAFTKVSALGVEEQRVNVVIDIRDPLDQRKSLGDAFRVEAKIVVWETKECLKVRAGALFRRGGDWAVFVVEGSRAKLRTVRIGRSNGIETEVLDGLREGDVVILHPSDRVADGTRVQARPR
jgi:HlyD family secretion protein